MAHQRRCPPWSQPEKTMNQVRTRLEEPVSGWGTAPVHSDVGINICLHSGTIDKVLAGLTIANGAAAMGTPAQIFFAVWSPSILMGTTKRDRSEPPRDTEVRSSWRSCRVRACRLP